ncbi:pimeloyl-ACP methyl ester esterase BioH [Arsenophonus endosymbiont of Aphis craccivora]|uniref:pimeloyl-ACP methyl ester esterase BioH n=1 Tax=Arsenophonus endosymbiont of Aphis craccivora TaxID=1231049 RepID=UPI0015DC6DEC|nr:pimeloyl-ACP methyl ester esterase BioH [Arsenophonus endosymbiont of Aphis craccivora]QLK88124.1 pimeloyl-ACP methyl ester esterase BioH [Arsenophonus endosymbiont of Aphis craccivora]
MTTLFWQQLGKGKQDIVLLHGWGLNAEVWRTIEVECGSHFRLHLVDLPGYGRSNLFLPMSLQQMAEVIWQKAPKQAIWLGWSLGVLIASIISLNHQAEIAGLITVASSPCFGQQENGPGIKPTVLKGFERQLQVDVHRTVERFLVLQTLGTKTANGDIRLLKSVILEQPLPSVAVLNAGLEILRTTDLRQSLLTLNKPFLCIYGDLDSLVPKKIVPMLDKWLPNSPAVVIKHAAHAPFISHPNQFIQLLVDFLGQLEK